jgi:hypothetical protein
MQHSAAMLNKTSAIMTLPDKEYLNTTRKE